MQADQAHEDVARMRAVIGLEEVGILPVENSLLNARSAECCGRAAPPLGEETKSAAANAVS